MTTAEDLVRDLKPLRKGRGLDGPRAAAQITAQVRVVFALDGESGAAVELADRLRELAAHLPPDLRLAVLAAYALTEHTRLPTLKERLDLVERELERDTRTVVRRVDEGLLLIAEAAIARWRPVPDDERAGTPWRTTALSCAVVMDQPTPQVYETRRVAVTGAPATGLDLEYSVPIGGTGPGPSPDNPVVEVLFGGTLRTYLRHSRSRVGYRLVLPKELAPNTEHEYKLRFTFADRVTMSPYYLCTPRYPCARFDLHVRFGAGRVPRGVWRIDGLFPNEVDDLTSPRDPLDIDPAGEVHLGFTNLVPRFSFGAAWLF
ncbi:hypothetical protein V5P93_005657 [Actinokineospora auranticolor]|uniref:Uncharacterized protein n=1 Tax=Actinokineospora auranticolor TaxID=155976 RepID=A0A2S6GEX1_9PSEU|nr:hypothetical protein [Actinokineospora auranticolor]PPK63788.1 hypothetical protein CLV40_12428 [Actinokineospora auranticolor]